MYKLNLIIKPTSECNLRCKYCYHASTEYRKGILPLSDVEKFFEIVSNEYSRINIIWHGGEPLLVGIDYFKDVMRLQKGLKKKKGTEFTNAIQTNGTLIDHKWCRLFKKNRILPGISFDGENNDFVRSEKEKVLASFRLLKKYRINCGSLSVIGRWNIDQVELYKYMKKYIRSVKFNPIFSETQNSEFSLSPAEYIASCKALFDYWVYDSKGIPLDPFVEYVHKAVGVPHGDCTHASCLGKWLDIDSSGVIRTCGQSTESMFVLGTINDIHSVSELFETDRFAELLKNAIERRKVCQQTCKFFLECQGGCIFKSHIEGGIMNVGGFSCLCFKALYSYAEKKMTEIIRSNTPLKDLNPEVAKIIQEAISVNPKKILALAGKKMKLDDD